MPRGRVSMNVTTFATSLASSRLPNSLASFSFSGGQSASSALIKGQSAMGGPAKPDDHPEF